MKAILVNEDKSLRWDDVPDPVLGSEDCLVKIEAAALNRADLMQREGGVLTDVSTMATLKVTDLAVSLR